MMKAVWFIAEMSARNELCKYYFEIKFVILEHMYSWWKQYENSNSNHI